MIEEIKLCWFKPGLLLLNLFQEEFGFNDATLFCNIVDWTLYINCRFCRNIDSALKACLLIYYNDCVAHIDKIWWCSIPDLLLHLLLTLHGRYNNQTLRQAAFLFIEVILCIQGHAVMFVVVYANPFIVNGLWICRNGRSGVMFIENKRM